MKVSVVLVHYNTPDLLLNCLKSLYAFTAGISFEVIVVDNASQNRPEPQRLGDFQRLTWIQNETNVGFGVANNQGVGMATGDYVFLLNTDTLFTDNLIKALYDKAQGIDKLGILAPRLLNHDLSVQYYGSMFGRFQYLGKKDRAVSFISGAAMFMKRTVYQSVGGFDPAYFFYNEDLDLCTTLRRAGNKLIYSPSLTLIHLGGGSTKPSKALKKQALISSGYYLKKHFFR